jgi:hypothetical protein
MAEADSLDKELKELMDWLAAAEEEDRRWSEEEDRKQARYAEEERLQAQQRVHELEKEEKQAQLHANRVFGHDDEHKQQKVTN